MISMAKPYISVLITCYTRKNYLMNAVYSALNQTLDKNLYEILVVKSFKDNNIDKILKEKKVRSIYIPPSSAKAVGSTLAVGIKKAKGNIICFLDDDDVFLSKKLITVYKFFKKHSNIGFYKNNFIFTNEFMSKEIKSHEIKKDYILNKSNMLEVFKFLQKGNLSSISIKKDVVIKYINYIKRISSITDIVISIISFFSDENLFYTNLYLSKYRIHKNSQSHTRIDISMINTINILSKIYKIKTNTQSDKFLNAYRSRVNLNYKILENKKIRIKEIFDYVKSWSILYFLSYFKLDKFLFLVIISFFSKNTARKLLLKAMTKVGHNLN